MDDQKSIAQNVQNEKQDDEISLIDLFAVLLRWKWMIITVTGIASPCLSNTCVIPSFSPITPSVIFHLSFVSATFSTCLVDHIQFIRSFLY